MGAPESGMEADEQPAADTLLTAFKTISAAERRRHASVLNYWLSIRGDKEFPPLHDLDPLEISDAAPQSVLLELISSGHDADIRHLGESLRGSAEIERIIDAPNPSILHSIAKKLPIVAISRDFLAFEDEFPGADGPIRCWVTLLPLSAGGTWVDYVYALVSVETGEAEAADMAEAPSEVAEAEDENDAAEAVTEAADHFHDEVAIEQVAGDLPDDTEVATVEAEEPEAALTEVEPIEAVEADDEEGPIEPVAPASAKDAPGFAKLLDSIAGFTGFYGQNVQVEPVMPAELPASEPTSLEPAASEDAAEEPAQELRPAPEGTLQSKLTEVRTKADEARSIQLRANAALYEGLSAAYDFALDAEDSPEEYLRLVEAQGLKIQLRSPMKPVVKLAFDGLTDESTIGQLEAVLAWALKEELPRGSLAARIEQAGGIGRILNGGDPAP